MLGQVQYRFSDNCKLSLLSFVITYHPYRYNGITIYYFLGQMKLEPHHLTTLRQIVKVFTSVSYLNLFIHFCCCWFAVVPHRIVSPYQMNPSSATKLRVVSYNLLSSHLSSPSYYTTINPDYLDPSNRLKIILNKLESEIQASNDDRPTIIALQEVSYDWAGSLHTFFANHGYHLTTGLYGQKFNGYMGIALAWPISSFTCVSTDIARLVDHRVGGWPEKAPEESFWQKLLVQPLKKIGLMAETTECHWNMSRRKHNVIVGATLKHKGSGTSVCIANYHMPCAFYAPKTMTIHSDMAIRYVQEMSNRASLAENKELNNEGLSTIPYILAGDFNLKPSDALYTYLTTGKLDTNDPYYPTPPATDVSFHWAPGILEPVNSAYALNGKEPDFTNYARVREGEPFVDTLDYIFVSPNNVAVSSVKSLPNRDQSLGPYPNLDPAVSEPSDHVLIAADLEISNST